MPGLRLGRLCRSFISSYALALTVFFFSAGTLYYGIMKNLLVTKKNLADLDRQIFVECVMMKRIKYAVETLDYDESWLVYEDCLIMPVYDFEDVTCTYDFGDYEVTRKYHYDCETKILTILE
ncbi:MAG: hypothetical protein II783_00205 [Erysipelotrichales bacterium]|nr:hypothetical protein [Erysipelotrichales bacterium]